MNRTTGAYTRTQYHDFGIWLRCKDGAAYQTVKRAPDSRIALGMAFGDCKGDGDKVLFCKRAEDMTRDERGQFDLSTDMDLARDRLYDRDRRAAWSHMADQY